MNEKMTIFYSKNTGEIKYASSGEVGFDTFLSNEEDMRSFCLRIVVTFNLDILSNTQRFKINLEENIIEEKEIKKFEPISF
ncbi:hypothetical protein ACQPUH_01815 [Clostridium perfringens]|uniref:hypothetical protein n=1 Tax=Clostridium perfringens TaxID=1502 RepID=UPI0018E42AC0|nr:hypothetical protein [Clostridium perfringens]MBI6016993.1 hypothetical protein [Clostridium perfringens]MDK0588549.1 hypothetical protein [Clostridium perfringens]MDM0527318.1 hypothetical protein [Clostridium perfringens]MDM0529229.1 hypothetical protein [Clostridium perfringens]MDM0539304.1 hypothetical protein [Clostridium perfringens]